MSNITIDSMKAVQRLQSLAQAGLEYCEDKYDRERYEEIRELSVQLAALLSGREPDIVRSLFANETGYQTPKIDVRAVVFSKGNILMVREEEDGCWALPGGWADIGFSAGEVAAKEVREEAGLLVKPVKLLAVLDKSKHDHPPSAYYTYKMFIACDIIDGKPAPGMETTAADFFAQDQLPVLSQRRITGAQIDLLFSFYHNPDKSTIFD